MGSREMSEGRIARWSRRAVTIPGVVSLAIVWLVLAPLTLPALALLDAFRGRRGAGLRLGCMAGVYLWAEAAGLVAATLLWLRFGLRRSARDRYRSANFRLQCWWAGLLLRAAQRIFSFRIDVETRGDLSRGPYLVLLRHASVADSLLGAALFSLPHRIRLRYVLKRELLWDPCLDVVGHRLPNVFVRRDGADSAGEARRVAALAADLAPDEAVLIYPEGTRFSPEKRQRALARLARADERPLLHAAQRLQHLLPPRPGGTRALLERRPPLDVVLCAHTGFEHAATFGALWNGALVGNTVQVRCERVAAERITDDAFAWLLDAWQDMDAWIGERLRATAAPAQVASPGARDRKADAGGAVGLSSSARRGSLS